MRHTTNILLFTTFYDLFFIFVEMRVIIAGSRMFDNYEWAKQKLDAILTNAPSCIEVVSGRCSRGIKTFTTDDRVFVYGADGIGERYAAEKGWPVSPFPADWKINGLAAGPMRNKQMAQYATHCICFSSGGKGTNSMIHFAREYKLGLRIIAV